MTFALQFAVAALPDNGRSTLGCVRSQYFGHFRPFYRRLRPVESGNSPDHPGAFAARGPLELHQPGKPAGAMPIPEEHR
jgi:hypothetical protein